MMTFKIGDRVRYCGDNKRHKDSTGIITSEVITVIGTKRAHVIWDEGCSMQIHLLHYGFTNNSLTPLYILTHLEQQYTQSQIGDKDDDI